MEILTKIQNEINAPKDKFNKFGGYKYRTVEGIYRELKPLLIKYGCTLEITDEIVRIGSDTLEGRYYVKSTATIKHEKKSVTSVGYAREEESKKGMDGSQITGASSSYARKYALNGLLLIDDDADSDTTNKHEVDENSIKKAEDAFKKKNTNFKPTIYKNGAKK